MISEYHDNIKVPKKRVQEEIVPFVKREKTKEFKDPYRPAALKKCEPFYSDQLTYQEEPNRLKKFRAQSKEERSSPRHKFTKEKHKGRVEHMYPFFPAHGPKSGKDGYFNVLKGIGVPFTAFPKIEYKNMKENNKKPFKDPFKYLHLFNF